MTPPDAYEQAIERALGLAPAQIATFERFARLTFTADERCAALDVARELLVDVAAPVPAAVAGWVASFVIALRRLPAPGALS